MNACRAIVATVGIAALAPAWQGAQAQSVRLSVRVRADGGTALRGASITVVMASDTLALLADTAGEASVVLPRPGRIVVLASAIGRRGAGRSVQVQPPEARVEFSLAPATGVLAPVRVVARDTTLAELAVRQEGADGAREEYLPGALGRPHGGGDDGSLTNIATALPGFDRSPDGRGFSVLGLGAEQSRTFLNGLPLAVSQLPRDLIVIARGSATPADALLGGFAGGAVDLGVLGGSNFRGLKVRAGGSGVGTTLPLDGALVPARTQANVMATFPVVLDRAYLLASGQWTRDAVPSRWLNEAGDEVLRSQNLSPGLRDSAVQTLAGVGVPTPRGAGQVRTAASLFAQFDVERAWGGALSSALALNHTTQSGLGATPTALATRAAGSEAASLSWNTRWRLPWGERRAWQTSVALSRSSRSWQPVSLMPAGQVAVAGLPGGDGASVATILFGGANASASDRDASGIALRSQVDLDLPGANHRGTVAIEGQWQAAGERTSPPFAAGRFWYSSLDSARQGRPAVFERTIATGSAANWSEAFAAVWSARLRFTPRRSLTYGARVEHQRVGGGTALDSAARSLVPDLPSRFSATTLSPRMGLTIEYGPRSNPFRGNLSLSAGRWVGQLPLEGSVAAFGQRAIASWRCAGTDVPTVDWVAGTTPGTCLSGGPSAAPLSAYLVARQLAPPSTWRASVSWREMLFNAFVWPQLDLTVSRTTGLPTQDDVNLLSTPQFTLQGEAGRPVLAALSSIDQASGSFALDAARRVRGVGAVMALDARGESRSVQAVASAIFPHLGPAQLRLSYAHTRADELVTGAADGRTSAGRAGLFAPSPIAPRHAVRAALNATLPGDILATAFGEWASGTPFTPVADRDLNGDGLANDAAFIPVLDGAAPGTPAAALRDRLSALPASIRTCVLSQQGRIARANSCEGAARVSLDARLDIPGPALGLPNRASVHLDLLNLPAALDRLLHGRDGLRGWGQWTAPDPVVWRVVGFDAASSAFRYRANDAFGDARRDLFPDRYAPFSARLEVRIDLSPSMSAQALRIAAAKRTDGARRQFVTDLSQRWPDPFEILNGSRESAVWQVADSIAVLGARRAFQRTLVEVWTSAASVVVDTTVADSVRRAVLRQAAARSDSAYEAATSAIRAHLGPDRVRLLDEFEAWYIAPGAVRRVRARID